MLFSSSWGIEPKSKLKILCVCYESKLNTFITLTDNYIQLKFFFYFFVTPVSQGTWEIMTLHEISL